MIYRILEVFNKRSNSFSPNDDRHIYSPKSTGNTQEAAAPSRHDEKLLTGTLSINTNKQTKPNDSQMQYFLSGNSRE